jgi:hypothetical protein
VSGATGGWFPSRASTPFTVRARELAATRLSGLVPAAASSADGEIPGSTLMIAVPGVPAGERPVITNLVQVLWDRGLLGGYWGCNHLWDGFDERDDEALLVRGVPLTDEVAAEIAVDWLASQLRRPLDHEVWQRADAVVFQRWVLSDTGRELGRRGHRGLRRGLTRTITRLRNDPAA